MRMNKKTMMQKIGVSEDAANVLMDFKNDLEEQSKNLIELIRNNRNVMKDLDLLDCDSHTCQAFIVEENIKNLTAVYLKVFIKEGRYKQAMDDVLEGIVKVLNSYKQSCEQEND